jgi:hypothetical protein
MGDLAIDLAIRLLLGGVIDENVDLAELLSGLFARRARVRQASPQPRCRRNRHPPAPGCDFIEKLKEICYLCLTCGPEGLLF